MASPELTVAVASHERPLRLRWLLNALDEQTLERDRFEVVVCHDSAGEATERALREHPLAAAGVLRHVRLPPGTGSAARQRNVAWRAGRAAVVVFTDDDCRPPADWLERVLAAVRRRPGAVVQGAVRPDPVEAHLLAAAPHARSLHVDPPVPWGQAANIAYPRAVLERLGGFDEAYARAGEDADLALRAIAAGVAYVGAPEALTFHAVAPSGLAAHLRTLPRWGDLARVVKRHPRVRRHLAAGVFWKPSHGWLLAAVPALARRRPAGAAVLVGWATVSRPRYGGSPRGLARAASELPGRAVVDLVEIAVLARGSARARTLLL
ncbi:MAG TPA: glycosyltransferase family A protein [Solirubrobacteraceae bacterium]